MTGEDRLEPHLRGNGIDGDGPLQQAPGRDGGIVKGDAGGKMRRIEMARAQAEAGFGMGLDQDRGCWMVVAGAGEHVLKGGGIGPRTAQRGISAGLVDQQDIAGRRRGEGGIVEVVFRQIRRDQPLHPHPRAVQKDGVIQRRGGKEAFQKRGPGGIEMHAKRINQKAERRIAHAAGAERAEEGILDADQGCLATGGHRLAPPGGGGLAPDHDAFARARQAGDQVMPRRGQDATQAGREEAAIQETKPPGDCPGGDVFRPAHGRISSPRRRC